jgi:ankyrin repeat protein
MALKGKSIDVVEELLITNPSIIDLQDKKGNATLHTTTRKWYVQVYIRYGTKLC